MCPKNCVWILHAPDYICVTLEIFPEDIGYERQNGYLYAAAGRGSAHSKLDSVTGNDHVPSIINDAMKIGKLYRNASLACVSANGGRVVFTVLGRNVP